jgi:hypothetical protein
MRWRASSPSSSPSGTSTRAFGRPATTIQGAGQFDLAGRLTNQAFTTPGGATAFQESLGWSPRSLKVTQARGDLNGAGFLFAYDKAGRATDAGRSVAPVATPNNATVDPSTLAGLPDSFGFRYDGGQHDRHVRLRRLQPPDLEDRGRRGPHRGVGWLAARRRVQGRPDRLPADGRRSGSRRRIGYRAEFECLGQAVAAEIGQAGADRQGMPRGKRLDIFYDPTITPKNRLNLYRAQLSKKFGNRVRWIPFTE